MSKVSSCTYRIRYISLSYWEQAYKRFLCPRTPRTRMFVRKTEILRTGKLVGGRGKHKINMKGHDVVDEPPTRAVYVCLHINALQAPPVGILFAVRRRKIDDCTPPGIINILKRVPAKRRNTVFCCRGISTRRTRTVLSNLPIDIIKN